MREDPPQRSVYRVSELLTTARELLEHSFALLWVEGEISNLARPRSGHWYFTLKDDNAQVRCAMFANRNRLVPRPPADGDQVLVRAKVSLYPARGDFQLIVESLADAGEGALQRAFEQTRDRLAAEGLFDQARKRPLPPWPRRIGVVTSGTGAALRDVLAVLRRRYPVGRILVHPVPVQGAAAPAAIVRGLGLIGSRGQCDVLLLVRGGGSLEDLCAFNDEAVARAIGSCPIPVITGVGHEVDVTIADFAADRRAPTPSAAAELACPDLSAHERRTAELQRRARGALQRRLAQFAGDVAALDLRLDRGHPARRIEPYMQRVDELEQRLRRGQHSRLRRAAARLDAAGAALAARHPRARLRGYRRDLASLEQRLRRAAQTQLHDRQQRWRAAARALDTVSPLNTLERGYAVVRAKRDQRVVTESAAVVAGDALLVTLKRGRLDCRVETSSDSPSRLKV